MYDEFFIIWAFLLNRQSSSSCSVKKKNHVHLTAWCECFLNKDPGGDIRWQVVNISIFWLRPCYKSSIFWLRHVRNTNIIQGFETSLPGKQFERPGEKCIHKRKAYIERRSTPNLKHEKLSYQQIWTNIWDSGLFKKVVQQMKAEFFNWYVRLRVKIYIRGILIFISHVSLVLILPFSK